MDTERGGGGWGVVIYVLSEHLVFGYVGGC